MEWSKFSPKALDFLINSYPNTPNDPTNLSTLNILHGAVRSGKTVVSIVRWLQYIQNGPPGTVLMVGKTKSTLTRNIINDLQDYLPSRFFKWIDRQEGLINIMGRQVFLVGANDEKAESKIRGATFAGAYIDEATLVPEGFFHQMNARCSVKGAQIFITTNPDSPYHWLKKGYIDNDSIKHKKIWHFVLDDNTALPNTFKNYLKSIYSGLWRKRFIEGLWVSADGAIFDMFDEDLHTFKLKLNNSTSTPPLVELQNLKISKWYASIDYGAANPTVALLVGWSEANQKYYILDEYYYDPKKENKYRINSEYAEDIAQFIEQDTYIQLGLNRENVQLIVDPSAASFIEELRRKKMRVLPANNEVLDGLGYAVELVGTQQVLINSQKCTNLLREIYGYSWDNKAQEHGEDKPIKKDDHAVDAFRYALFTTRWIKSAWKVFKNKRSGVM